MAKIAAPRGQSQAPTKAEEGDPVALFPPNPSARFALWRNHRRVRPIGAKRFGVWRLASAMEGFAAWLKAEASLHTPKLETGLVLGATGLKAEASLHTLKLENGLVLRATGLKAEASLHTPKRFAQIRPLISQMAATAGMSSRFSRPQVARPSAPNVVMNHCL